VKPLVTGRDYVRALDARKSDRDCRAAFLDLARSLLPPGATVFDFGCGPGVDARVFAELGHRVYAYDVDAKMCEYFREECADGLASGAVRLLETGDFPGMPADELPRVDLVSANFAPLNLIPKLTPVFERFARMLAPGGRVLASMLNPLHSGDVRYGWWWRGLPRLVARGHYSVAGAQAPITRWLPGTFARVAGPSFRLEAVYVAAPRRSPPWRRVEPASPGHWPAIMAARYLFVSFTRRATSA
jgi:SAM-dependent methyltransferase